MEFENKAVFQKEGIRKLLLKRSADVQSAERKAPPNFRVYLKLEAPFTLLPFLYRCKRIWRHYLPGTLAAAFSSAFSAAVARILMPEIIAS